MVKRKELEDEKVYFHTKLNGFTQYRKKRGGRGYRFSDPGCYYSDAKTVIPCADKMLQRHHLCFLEPVNDIRKYAFFDGNGWLVLGYDEWPWENERFLGIKTWLRKTFWFLRKKRGWKP